MFGPFSKRKFTGASLEFNDLEDDAIKSIYSEEMEQPKRYIKIYLNLLTMVYLITKFIINIFTVSYNNKSLYL